MSPHEIALRDALVSDYYVARNLESIKKLFDKRPDMSVYKRREIMGNAVEEAARRFGKRVQRNWRLMFPLKMINDIAHDLVMQYLNDHGGKDGSEELGDDQGRNGKAIQRA